MSMGNHRGHPTMTYIERFPRLEWIELGERVARAMGMRKEYLTKTFKHHWAVCDVCGEGTYVLSSNLEVIYGSVDGVRIVTDPVPGRVCRMTPKCNGKHRKV